jgi:hypothetical protein
MANLLRRHAKVFADFSYDGVEQGSVIVRPGGLASTKAIAEILTALGLSVSAPMDAGDHGWELVARGRGLAIWFQITDLGDHFMLMSRANTSASDAISAPGATSYAGVLMALNAGLRRHPRVSKISWVAEPFGEDGFDAPLDDDGAGASSPPGGPPAPAGVGQVPGGDPPPRPANAETSAVRPCAEFVGDFPKDLVEEGDRLVRPNGLAAITALGEMLAGLGLSVGKPDLTENFGWRVDVRGKGLRAGFALNDYDETFLLRTQETTPAWQKMLQRQPVTYPDVLTRLNEALRQSPKISRLTWHAEPYDGKGMETPVDATA